MFEQIAPVYDTLNRIISWGRDQKWRRDLAHHMDLNPGQRVLDISAGTGDMEPAIKSISSEIEVVGIDPSRSMTDLYRAKIPGAVLTQGVAEFLPFVDRSIDCAVCTFGLRNFENRPMAYREIHRVLKSGGIWGFLEMSAPSGDIFAPVYGFYFKRIVPQIGRAFSSGSEAYAYLSDSVYTFPGIDLLEIEHSKAGFSLQFSKLFLRGAVILAVFEKH